MKVQLVVVRGKPEGKVIPLVGPSFKIGRGETCHLRPSSEQISREHAEFSIIGGVVEVKDLGSRNGTLVNGKALTSEACKLKDRDLVQVGPLTFAVSIMDAPAAAVVKPVAAPQAKAPVKSLDDVSGDEIDSWLLGDGSGSGADRPTTVFGGDTITITAFKDTPPPAAKPVAADASVASPKPPSVSDDEYERQEDEEEEVEDVLDQGEEEESEREEEEEESDDAPVEELIDESNPFYAAKKAQKQAAGSASGPAKQAYKDTSDAANDILRKLMEKRRANR